MKAIQLLKVVLLIQRMKILTNVYKKVKIKLILISFSKEEWLKIKPQEKMRKDGFINFRLQRGWTDAFVQKIWNKYKIPCTYCFSEEKVYKEIQKSYIKIQGYCKECKNQLLGKCLKYPINDNDNVIFHIYTLIHKVSVTKLNVV